MNESAKLESYKKKLEGVCDANDLQFRLSLDTYPISMTISPLDDLDSQISMLEAADEDTPYNSVDAKLVFTVRDGDLNYRISERFTISKALMNKLTNLFENIHRCYVQMFHRDVIERGLLNCPYVPSNPDTDSNERETEPLEEYEPEEAPDVPDFPDDFMEGENG
jgi:hypothetical protein